MKIYSVPIYEGTEGPLCDHCGKQQSKWMRCAYRDGDGSLILKKELCPECPFEVSSPEVNIQGVKMAETPRLSTKEIADQMIAEGHSGDFINKFL